MVAEGQFRSDLYYRLRVFPILLPPLRERREDIPLLVRYFVDRHARKLYKKIETIPDETMRALTRWDWPGNIRELENFIERAVILTKGRFCAHLSVNSRCRKKSALRGILRSKRRSGDISSVFFAKRKER